MPCLAAAGGFASLDYLVLGAYLAGMVAIGWHFARREKNTDGYFRGGRRIPWWAAGLSIFGTALSAITYMSVPGQAFADNWVMVMASVAPLLLVPVVTGVCIPFYRRLNVTTPYEYLKKRFNTAVQLLAGCQWMLFQFARIAIILYLPSIALNAATGLDVYACILVMGLLTTLYTAMGGIKAAIWTDVVQVVVLMGGAVVSLVFILAKIDGGLAGMIHQAAAAGKFHMFNWSLDLRSDAVWVIALGTAVSSFGVYTTDQSLVQRYMSTPTAKQAKRALWTSALGGVPTGLLFFLIGTALWVFYRQHQDLLPAGMPNDQVFALFIVQQLPAGVAGLLIAGIFAAAMSSITSGVNSISAIIITDFVRPFRRMSDEGRLLRLSRVLSAGVGVVGTAIAMAMATWNIYSLYTFFITMVGLFTGGLAGLFVLGIFTRRASAAGSLTGAAVSAAAMGLAQIYPQFLPVNKILYGVVSLAICIVVGYAASVVLPQRGKSLAGLTIFTLVGQAGEQPEPAGHQPGQAAYERQHSPVSAGASRSQS